MSLASSQTSRARFNRVALTIGLVALIAPTTLPAETVGGGTIASPAVGPAPANAIGGGFLELLNNNGNTIVRFDSTGGADSFVTLAVVTNAVLTESDLVL